MLPSDSLTLLMCVHSPDDLRDRLLHRSMNSIVKQTYLDFDTLIVLDECRESAINIVDSFKDKLRLRTLIRPKKAGLASAKNAGLADINTVLTAYLDADDAMMPCKLEVQLEYLKKHPEISVLSTEAWDYLDGILKPSCYRGGDYESHESIVEALSCGENPMVHGSCIVRTDHIKSIGGYRDIRGREDMDLYIRMINAGYRIGKMPERLYFYSLGTGVAR